MRNTSLEIYEINKTKQIDKGINKQTKDTILREKKNTRNTCVNNNNNNVKKNITIWRWLKNKKTVLPYKEEIKKKKKQGDVGKK